jgi:hypothetical protein
MGIDRAIRILMATSGTRGILSSDPASCSGHFNFLTTGYLTFLVNGLNLLLRLYCKIWVEILQVASC